MAKSLCGECYAIRWKEAMVELLDQLELLDPISSIIATEGMQTPDPAEKFQHFATLYIR